MRIVAAFCVVVLSWTGCRRNPEAVKTSDPPEKEAAATAVTETAKSFDKAQAALDLAAKAQEAGVDPRISTEVLLTTMALSQAGVGVSPAKADETRANFQKMIAAPLQEAANGEIDRKQLLVKLVPALTGEDAYVSMETAMIIGRLADRKDEFLIARFLPALEDQRPHVRGNVAAVLETLRARAAVPSLIRLLEDANAAVAVNAASALGAIGDPRAIEPLILLLGRLPQSRCGYDLPSVAHIVPKVPYLWIIDKELEERYRKADLSPDYATASSSMPLDAMLETQNKTLCDYLRWHGVDALRKLTGKRFGERADLWLMWWRGVGAGASKTKRRPGV
ncbi:MAG TPA: HEAT repeat domain-containing protein [Thermoanaerobaculia bacterium]|nr:HEAT repeat domain-containing protein [Thermoanaerobaculia bacterium]